MAAAAAAAAAAAPAQVPLLRRLISFSDYFVCVLSVFGFDFNYSTFRAEAV